MNIDELVRELNIRDYAAEFDNNPGSLNYIYKIELDEEDIGNLSDDVIGKQGIRF